MKINPIIINLVSRRFVGFCLGLLVSYLKPEIKDTVIVLYSAMVAHSSFKDWVEGKQQVKKEE